MMIPENRIYIPSFEFERKTKALNKMIWGFVAMISAFTVTVPVGAMHLAFSSINSDMYGFVTVMLHSQIVSILLMSMPIVAFLALAYQMYQFIACLSCSYVFTGNQIIKGQIIDANDVSGGELVSEALTVSYMAANIGNHNRVAAASAARGVSKTIKLIRLNTNPEFVYKFFYTDLYVRKVYTNPKLIKETKYSLVYSCDNKRKLVIPKIYPGMCREPEDKPSSLKGRIIKRSLIVFVSCVLISITDLRIAAVGGVAKNAEIVANISKTHSQITKDLERFGYTGELNKMNCRFEKKVCEDEYTSLIWYFYDRKGNIKDARIDIVFEKTEIPEEEITYVMESLGDTFTVSEISRFLDAVEECMEGKIPSAKLDKDKNDIFVRDYGDVIHIYKDYE